MAQGEKSGANNCLSSPLPDYSVEMVTSLSGSHHQLSAMGRNHPDRRSGDDCDLIYGAGCRGPVSLAGRGAGIPTEFFNFPGSPARPMASRFGCEEGKGLDA